MIADPQLLHKISFPGKVLQRVVTIRLNSTERNKPQTFPSSVHQTARDESSNEEESLANEKFAFANRFRSIGEGRPIYSQKAILFYSKKDRYPPPVLLLKVTSCAQKPFIGDGPEAPS